jgi:hypothetical protein
MVVLKIAAQRSSSSAGTNSPLRYAKSMLPGPMMTVSAPRPGLCRADSQEFWQTAQTSSGGNSICSVETDAGCVSTSTFMTCTVAARYKRRLTFCPVRSRPSHKPSGSVKIRTNTRARDSLGNQRSRSSPVYLLRVTQSYRRGLTNMRH